VNIKMTSENNENAESYVMFDGKDVRKFREWTAATTKAGLKEGWLGALISNVTLDRASEKAEDIAAVLNNDLAYDYMVKTCTDDALEYVRTAKTANSYGDARMAWKNLYDRYYYATGDPIMLSKEWGNCKMKKPNDDPCQWYAELEYLLMRMERAGMQKKTEAEVVAIIMDRMPTEYDEVTSALRAIPDKRRALDLVRVTYWEYWDANLKSVEKPKESGGNVGSDTDNADKYEGDAFFVGMSINEEPMASLPHPGAAIPPSVHMASTESDVEDAKLNAEQAKANSGDEVQLFRHRTWSQQVEYEEFLRRKEEKIIREMFGSKEEPEPKRRPRMCAVCGTEGPWNLVCNECEVSPERLERQIQRTRKKVQTLAFCEGCGHHGEKGFLCIKCNDRASTYTIDGTDGWRPRIFKYDTDSEDEDYIPTESQSDVEYDEESTEGPTTEQEPWDRVWAYCADCSTRGDVYLRCEVCYRNRLKNGSGCSSQEECRET